MRSPSASARRLCAACALAIALQIPCGLCACAGQPHAASSSSEQASSSVAQQESGEPEPGESKPSEPEPGESEPTQEQPSKQTEEQSKSLLLSPADIGLHAVDDLGQDWGQSYAFTYADEEFSVYYEPDTWKIYDSYKIEDHDDLVTICQALLDEHPIHGIDLQSYRTAEDMAFEWEQHNLAYRLLPNSSSWKESAKNVDLDPDDQGKTFAQMYASRQ